MARTLWRKRIGLPVTVSLVALLSGCFLQNETAYMARVNVQPPDPSTPPICQALTVHAVFGVNVLLDIKIAHDEDFNDQLGYEGRSSRAQRYYAGMPLVVDVDCHGESDEVIGSAHYEARLIRAGTWAHFVVWNYLWPDQEPDYCVTPTTSSGVIPCASMRGFAPVGD